MESYMKIVFLAFLVLFSGAFVYQQRELKSLRRSLAELNRKEDPAKAETGYDDSDLKGRLFKLEQTVARIFGMILNGQKGTVRKADPRDLGNRVANLRDDVDALLTGEALDTADGRKRLHKIVRQAQQKAHAERRQRRQAFHRQMIEHRMKEFADSTGVSERQAQEAMGILDQLREQRRSLFDAMRQGQKTYGETMTELRNARKEAEQKLGGILDEQQLDQFKQTFLSRGRGRGGFGRF